MLHGHAHAGTFEGRLGDVPVYNVSVPVMGEDFWVFEMTGARRMPSEVHYPDAMPGMHAPMRNRSVAGRRGNATLEGP